MEDTGRIRRLLDPRARAIVFARVDESIEHEMPFYVRIDHAHVVMLVERGILPPSTGRALLGAIEELVAQSYAPLRGREAPRGLYLLYEQFLSDAVGEEIGGAIHVGRSRNDINATVLRLRLRAYYHRLACEVLRLLAVLIRRSRRYASLTMPIYTHHQAALPGTYGHYLAGVALALGRDLRGILLCMDAERCPLGAGAAGGTTIPIDTERTARLLGFEQGVQHSVDAVASRDVVLRLLGAAATLGVTLSRLAADLQFWSAAELGFLRFPDSLVGSSSMMPQKRNAFLLEHITGRSGAPLGALTAATLAMHATPFSNSVAVGTEAVRPFWGALDDVTDATLLARLMVAGAEPDADAMGQRAAESFTVATEIANRLVLGSGMPFRRAHRLVGELISKAVEQRGAFADDAAALFREHGVKFDEGWLDPVRMAADTSSGGGPARASLQRILTEATEDWRSANDALRAQVSRWRGAQDDLGLAVQRLRQPTSPESADRSA